MSKVIMLTKDGCPQCMAAKMILEKVLNNKYSDNIEIVKKEENQDEYERLVSEYGIMSMPALIAENNVLKSVNPNSLIDFLKTNVGF